VVLTLLSHEGQSVQAIAFIRGVCRQTISVWLTNWETKGLGGLFDKPGRGRRKKLSIEDISAALTLVNESPRSLKHVL